MSRRWWGVAVLVVVMGGAGAAIAATAEAPKADAAAAAVDTSASLTLDKLPPAVKETFLKQAGGNPIRGISSEMRNGKLTYDCDVFISGVKNEVIVDADGKLMTPPLSSATPEVKAAPAAFVHATLVKVDGKNLIVKFTGETKETTVPTDDKTKFVLDYEAGAKLSDLAAGMTLTILPATGTATTVKAHVKGLYGTVVKVDGKNLVLAAAKTQKEVTVATDDKTKVVINGKAGAKLADLKVGTEVKVVPETGTAAKVAMVIPQPAPAKAAAAAPAKAADEPKFQDTFNVDKATLADHGRGKYFVLEPGYTLTYKVGVDTLTKTVLDETKMVDGVKCRIVEERETKDGKLEEISRNYLAIAPKTGDVYYFGEAVDMYDAAGKVTTHDGSWEAGKDGAKFGLFLPGNPIVGVRYYQEVAPKVALDRAEVISITEEVKVPAGTFKNCLKTRESSGLEATIEEKLYAPDVGLLKDADFELVKIEKAPAKAEK